LLLLALPALLFLISPTWADCPDGPDCLWVDVGVCGQCAGDASDCGTNADCSSGTCEGGSAGNGTQASPYCTVNEAFRNAASGDTIYVGPGTYRKCVDVSPLGLSVPEDRPVHLLARAFAESSENPDTIADTVFDGSDLCVQGPTDDEQGLDADDEPVVTIESSGSSMRGFTVTGGEAGGIFVSGGSVELSHNRVTGNSSVEGGGIAILTEACAPAYGGVSTVVVTDNDVTSNSAIAGPEGELDEGTGAGGGIWVFASEAFGQGCSSVATVTIEDNLISDNTMENTNLTGTGARFLAKGGGVWITTAMEPGGTALVRLIGNEITGNGPTVATADSAGGGVFATTLSTGFGDETIVIEENQIGPDNVAHEGGGMAAWVTSSFQATHHVSVAKNEIRDNTAISESFEGAGGGASLRLEAVDVTTGDSVSIEFAQNEVTGNLADSSDGGGLRASLLTERSVDEPLGINVNPLDRMELVIRDNVIRNNESGVGGAGAFLSILADSDPGNPPDQNGNFPTCDSTQLPAAGTIVFQRNLISDNLARNTSGFDEVGAGILTIPNTVGLAKATIRIEENTVAGNTIISEFESSGGVETLPFADQDCNGAGGAVVAIEIDRSIVSGNDAQGIGGTPVSGFPGLGGTLQVPVTNSYVFGHPDGNFDTDYYPAPPASSFQDDPQLTGAFAPAACSPVFGLKVCEGTTTTCIDNLDCPAGPPQVPCLSGAGFHGNPDVEADSIVDGLDILELAVSFNSTDAPDPRYLEAADLDHNGIVDGADLSYMGSQFGQVCLP
jgi:hypothetical protein